MVQTGTQRTQGMERCIRDCEECQRVSVETSVHCLGMGGEHAGAAHQMALIDCAKLCRLSADFMVRGSGLHARTCGVCAEACERCAESCESLAGGDTQMKACAEVCRRCAASCREMAGRM